MGQQRLDVRGEEKPFAPVKVVERANIPMWSRAHQSWRVAPFHSAKAKSPTMCWRQSVSPEPISGEQQRRVCGDKGFSSMRPHGIEEFVAIVDSAVEGDREPGVRRP